ncbi:hypothetical protein IF1G_02135 [Cordyceps javanica]|uniref:Uncharacterized protein n=1 Tax=Cordyceps javanica TaxID=43265 RepID=A0A545VDX6_9HYPO|nr:hypothetical protein IF1G_02135 [Cordyceps javanica]
MASKLVPDGTNQLPSWAEADFALSLRSFLTQTSSTKQAKEATRKNTSSTKDLSYIPDQSNYHTIFGWGVCLEGNYLLACLPRPPQLLRSPSSRLSRSSRKIKHSSKFGRSYLDVNHPRLANHAGRTCIPPSPLVAHCIRRLTWIRKSLREYFLPSSFFFLTRCPQTLPLSPFLAGPCLTGQYPMETAQMLMRMVSNLDDSADRSRGTNMRGQPGRETKEEEAEEYGYW